VWRDRLNRALAKFGRNEHVRDPEDAVLRKQDALRHREQQKLRKEANREDARWRRQ
jgi:hypothetical protein